MSEQERDAAVDAALAALVVVMDDVTDPRGRQGKRHLLTSVLTIAVLGCLCGCDDAEALQDWAEKEEDWLSDYLELRWGVPSQDTFLRVLAMIDPREFRMAFMRWVRGAFPRAFEGGQVAIDGKTARRSGDKQAEQAAVHMVSALAVETRVVLGQQATPDKTNELTAIRQLLYFLHLDGALVSIDAMGCQRDIAGRIVDGGGDYMLAVTNNQPTLLAQVSAAYDATTAESKRNVDIPDPPSAQATTTVDAGHGRIETRTTTVLHDFDEHLDVGGSWKGLTTLIRVEATREDERSGKSETHVRHFISSRHLDAETAAKHVRAHWEVENGLHHVLDVSFGEDSYMARKKNAAANFIVIRHFAVNLIRAFKGDKLSVPRRRRLCDYRLDYREQLLAEVAM